MAKNLIDYTGLKATPVPLTGRTEETDLMTKRHYLRNAYGWVYCYVTNDSGPDWNRVVIRTTYRGEPARDLILTREEAREHWKASVQKGFHTVSSKF